MFQTTLLSPAAICSLELRWHAHVRLQGLLSLYSCVWQCLRSDVAKQCSDLDNEQPENGMHRSTDGVWICWAAQKLIVHPSMCKIRLCIVDKSDLCQGERPRRRERLSC